VPIFSDKWRIGAPKKGRVQEIITVLWRVARLPHCGGQGRDPE
jgi:hypothetical protein